LTVNCVFIQPAPGGVTRCCSTGCTRPSPLSLPKWRKSTQTCLLSPPLSSNSTPN
jgi:hypothetical protein